MSVEVLRAMLEGFGYEIRFREHEWVECFLFTEKESWTGRGPDRRAALEDAVAHACPSQLARALLERAVAEATEQASAKPAPKPRQERSTSDTRRSGPPTLVAKEPLAAPDLSRSLEELAIIEQRIRDTKDELGLCAPERQRLALYAFICEARGHTETFPEEARVRDAVAVISRLLTEIGKSFWPGSVTALQLHMQPRDLPRHLLGGVATTWTRAAELAERALIGVELGDERRGFDSYGWADPPESRPAPIDAEGQVDQLLASIEKKTGTLDRAEPREGGKPEADEFLYWVRRLRWLRGSASDPDKWSRAAGRLRWWTGRRDPSLGRAARELDPAFIPPITWLDSLAEDIEVKPDRELPADLIERVRGAYNGKRLVFVSTRRDPDLQARLTGAIVGAELEWRVAEPKRLHDLGEAIASKQYDVVLSALGFSSLGADPLLARACKDAGVGYLRVNRGRPIACLRALARACVP
jgi:hypothetical protein